MMTLNDRHVVDAEIDGVYPDDYPDFSDAYFSDAYFKDDGSRLTDQELEQLTDLYGEILNELAFHRCL
jgi:hypothetical protein